MRENDKKEYFYELHEYDGFVFWFGHQRLWLIYRHSQKQWIAYLDSVQSLSIMDLFKGVLLEKKSQRNYIHEDFWSDIFLL